MREYEVLIQAGFEGTLCFRQIKHTSSVAWKNMYYDHECFLKRSLASQVHSCITYLFNHLKNLQKPPFFQLQTIGRFPWRMLVASTPNLLWAAAPGSLKTRSMLASIPKVLIPHWLLLKVSELHHLATLMARNTNSYKWVLIPAMEFEQNS